ncbi:saccharopine dehydrogenase [Fusarium flagelliforme]|uniref:Saccharopine dehydrogenase n=1 Tax=Fusarium flagelliforme TaxID=2675880 RepID=A0A395MCS3_9HYPO|nr:saccharopine dehydrogenase [Fusarium flagelliforme]KAH7198719.1 saccharopine dehydrogenase [Fusarium flagelliforme]RFN45651.1 saccharopine dehydrogenase [Fusarium flagelliforme]
MTAKNILILGSGMVAKPCVDFLLRSPTNNLTIACRTLSTAQQVAAGRARTNPITLDVSSPELDRSIADHDVVISLVPFTYHASVVRSAIRGKTNVVTTSYVSSEIRSLEQEAKQAGITVLNEVGMDPGIDHLYAVKTIDEVHEKGGKVLEFYSYCGGLPAPEASDNPLRFKFSWSPRGALLSQLNSATFLKDRKVVEVPNKDLMDSAVPYHILDGYSFLAYPNRDSTSFREAYRIPEAHTVIRGTLRYEGNPAMVKALIELGWLDSTNKDWLQDGMTWAMIQQKMTGAASTSEADLVAKVDEICSFTSSEQRAQILSGLKWIGLFSDFVPQTRGNLLDTLSAQLDQICSYQPGERDLVMLQHKFVVEWKDGTKDTITSTLELFGGPGGYSAMAKGVGLTCGIATQLLLDGNPAFNKPGILAPYSRELCDPIRARVEDEGIKLVERVL